MSGENEATIRPVQAFKRGDELFNEMHFVKFTPEGGMVVRHISPELEDHLQKVLKRALVHLTPEELEQRMRDELVKDEKLAVLDSFEKAMKKLLDANTAEELPGVDNGDGVAKYELGLETGLGVDALTRLLAQTLLTKDTPRYTKNFRSEQVLSHDIEVPSDDLEDKDGTRIIYENTKIVKECPAAGFSRVMLGRALPVTAKLLSEFDARLQSESIGRRVDANEVVNIDALGKERE